MRIKDVVTLRNDKTTDISKPYIALENIVSWDAKFIESEAETEGTNNVFKKGDILFGKLRPYLAKGFCPSYDGICSTEFFVMRPKKKDANQKYLLFFFLSDPIIDYIKNQVTGVKMPRTKWSDFGNIAINMPSLKEQQRIVDYLDEKLAKIDGRIAVLEKQQGAYARLKKSVIHQAVTRGLNPNVPLKDSGTEWIGMIPEHWNVRRIKEVGELKLGKMLDEKPKDGYSLRPYLKSKNIGWLELKLDEVEDMFFSESEMNILRLHEGDIVISEGGEVGKSAYWTGELQECYIQNSVQKLTLYKGFCSKYYLYLSFLLGQMGYYKSIVNLVSIMHLTYEKLRKVVVLCPPLSEQQAIANYLDEKCAQIDAAIENIGKQIDASKRLKRALINEVITGQRAV